MFVTMVLELEVEATAILTCIRLIITAEKQKHGDHLNDSSDRDV